MKNMVRPHGSDVLRGDRLSRSTVPARERKCQLATACHPGPWALGLIHLEDRDSLSLYSNVAQHAPAKPLESYFPGHPLKRVWSSLINICCTRTDTRTNNSTKGPGSRLCAP